MKTLLKQHIALIAAAGILLICIGTILFSRWYNETQFENKITTQTTQANKAVQESKVESGVAANLSIERRGEDAVRDRVIKPKLDDARRRSANSKSNFETAKKNYEIKKTDTENLTSDDLDNCRQLRDLFPDVAFENCQ